MPHVFDVTNTEIFINGRSMFDNTPLRLKHNDNKFNIDYCFDDIDRSQGNILYSGSSMSGQISCSPHVYNVGNLYNFTFREDSIRDSICPLNWELPNITGEKSIYYVTDLYTITSHQTIVKEDIVSLILSPLSYVFGGFYPADGGLIAPGNSGLYRTNDNTFWINENNITTYPRYLNNGFSLRCGGRYLCYNEGMGTIDILQISVWIGVCR